MSCVLTDKILPPPALSTMIVLPVPGTQGLSLLPGTAWRCKQGHPGTSPSSAICAPMLLSDLAQIQQRFITGVCCDGATPSAWQGDIWLLRGGCGLCDG